MLLFGYFNLEVKWNMLKENVSKPQIISLGLESLMPYFDQILVSLFPGKNSVRLSIFHSGHFCTGMWITRGHTPIYKNCSKDRAETSYFLSYIVFLHVSSLPVLLKSLSTYINLHCHFSWQLWISTIERFRPSFPHASLQSTKSTKTESKSNH